MKESAAYLVFVFATAAQKLRCLYNVRLHCDALYFFRTVVFERISSSRRHAPSNVLAVPPKCSPSVRFCTLLTLAKLTSNNASFSFSLMCLCSFCGPNATANALRDVQFELNCGACRLTTLPFESAVTSDLLSKSVNVS